MRRRNPYIIECKFVGKILGRHDKWSRWGGYSTEKRRDQALAALRSSKQDWIQFRKGKDPKDDTATRT